MNISIMVCTEASFSSVNLFELPRALEQFLEVPAQEIMKHPERYLERGYWHERPEARARANTKGEINFGQVG
jgi:hypothetical protein